MSFATAAAADQLRKSRAALWTAKHVHAQPILQALHPAAYTVMGFTSSLLLTDQIRRGRQKLGTPTEVWRWAGGQGGRGSISQDLYRGAIGQSAGQMMRQSSRRASIAAGALLKQLQVHSHTSP